MGLRILQGVQDGDSDGHAILYDNTTGIPLQIEMFEDANEAEEFIIWLGTKGIEDARTVAPAKLRAYQAAWWKHFRTSEVRGGEA